MKIKTTVIIPVKNEEQTISKFVRLLLTTYDAYINEILIIDDGSTDSTFSVISELSKKYRKAKPVKRSFPFGVGIALREGLKRVSKSSNYVLTLDADFVRNISDLEDFFNIIPQYDGIIGSRYKEKYSLIHYPWLKKVFNRLFHLLIKIIFQVKNSDLTNNFKLYKISVYKSLPLTASDFSINAETGLYPILLGYNIYELSVPWFARRKNMGTSKFNLFMVTPGYLRVIRNALSIPQQPSFIVRLLRKILPKQ